MNRNTAIFTLSFVVALIVTIALCERARATPGALTTPTPPPSIAVCEVTVTDPWSCRVDCGGGNTAECHASTIGGTGGGAGYSLCKFSDGSLHGYTGNVCY